MTRLDAWKAIIAKPAEDDYVRVLQYSYKQADPKKVRIDSEAGR